MMKKFIMLSLIFSLFVNQEVQAWAMTGHRVIAEIAERHLSKRAKKNIQKIIGQQKLAYWSNWADFVKSDPELNKRTSSWHYINADGNQSLEQFRQTLAQSSPENLYKAYLRLKEQTLTEGKALSLEQQQQTLYFIVHLFADAHQPMHVGRVEDLGGNRVEVNFFREQTNIHAVWDSDLVDNEMYSYTEYADVLDIHPSSYYNKYRTSFEDVLYESHTLANRIYADAADNAQLGYRYIYDYKYIMEECLLKAGIRLAWELNEIYGG